ncbi:MAG: ribosomal RNA small subunit methyltransferase A [Verrucomicrobia bacterium]|nr:ribosomal RNA small subunit methyltransferase A [Verrucomicrobiota bacterium]MBU6445832.1 ribosomal RNA small subunit methyltransferase A [Verrucomicrobiota bacterium]MDE3048252.1 ribosomal RNA small subunit methyltransferase A [Verrucomicrobiota bacterium]
MILSELIPFLKSIEAVPKRGLSQNFLIDPNILQKIVALAQVAPGEQVLEIGPGPGALTAALLDAGAKVWAVETDEVFARHLHRLQNGRLQIYLEDFLKFPMHVLPPKIKVVANLPYHITTPILEKLFAHSFSSIVIMVQKEVAERMQAKPGTKELGSLTLFVQFYSQISASFDVPAGCFYPKPKVDSTVIRLDAKTAPTTAPFHLIRPAFQHRRKMLAGILPYAKEKVKQALLDIGIRPDARPEMLSLDQWIQLTEKLR